MATIQQKIIVVIGMHRTGTSLITRALKVLGVNLGENLLPAMAEVNAKGFWEDADINKLNIQILHSLQTDWDGLSPITNENLLQLNQQGYFLKAVDLLRFKMKDISFFGLKDPRIVKLLPFWDSVFSHCGYDVNYVMTIRHPLSVVRSLQKRDAIDVEKAYFLWFTHVVYALPFAMAKNAPLIDYDLFMDQPSAGLNKLASNLSLQVDEIEERRFLDEFVDDNLRHTRYALDDLSVDQHCPPVVKDMYGKLLSVVANEKNLAAANLGDDLLYWTSFNDVWKVCFSLMDRLYINNGMLARRVDEQTLLLEQQVQESDTQKEFIRKLEAFNQERAAQVELLYQSTLERDVHIQKLTVELATASQEVVSAQASAKNYATHLAQVKLEVEQLTEMLHHKDASLVSAQSVALNLQAQKQDAEQKILHLQSEQQANEQTIQLLNYQVNTLYAEKQQLLNSRSWRITKPMRFITRVWQHGLNLDDKIKLKLLAKKGVAWLPYFVQKPLFSLYRSSLGRRVSLPVNHLAVLQSSSEQVGPNISLSKSSGRDYIVWGVIDWHFRHQRPQQIAQALAHEGDRVFYVSSNLIPASESGFFVESLDDSGKLFQINLCIKDPVAIYHHAPSLPVLAQMQQALGKFLHWAETAQVVNIVQHPFWHELAQSVPDSTLVYDCMDHHEGFENTGKEIVALEHALLAGADLTITTSGWLDEVVSKYTSRRTIIRNAGEYEYFSQVPTSIYADKKGRKIIGYYGAIAEWFDVELIRRLSDAYADSLILLIGADTASVQPQLKSCKNVEFVGEVPYNTLTQYLYAFDVCLLPFKVIPLIMATNPVKVYEYLGTGKPVVAVDVPEIKQFGDLVRTGKNQQDFVLQVGEALREVQTPEVVAARKVFAEQQTWHHRARDLSAAVQRIKPKDKVSVILVTYNNLDLTKACLHSLETYTHYDNLEIIIVDNASADGTPDYLTQWATGYENRKVILSPDNTGFAAGNNMGLRVATGDYLVLLNNDTYVTPGWVAGLKKHLDKDPTIGLIGPATNNIGNESKINIHYESMEQMHVAAKEFNLAHLGQLTPLRTAAFFCVMMSRATFEKIGLLDEAFGIGFFEDDDYCRRVEQAGLKVVCADDVFIHHHLSASFNKLKIEARQKLFESNKVIYEQKWGEWVPHKYRPGVN